ncbi:unnamed protein product, partial [Ixodes persulcatus]
GSTPPCARGEVGGRPQSAERRRRRRRRRHPHVALGVVVVVVVGVVVDSRRRRRRGRSKQAGHVTWRSICRDGTCHGAARRLPVLPRRRHVRGRSALLRSVSFCFGTG